MIYNCYDSITTWNKQNKERLEKQLIEQEEKSWTTIYGTGDDPIVVSLLRGQPPTWVHVAYSLNGQRLNRYNSVRVSYRGSTIKCWFKDEYFDKGQPDMIIDGATEIEVYKGALVSTRQN